MDTRGRGFLGAIIPFVVNCEQKEPEVSTKNIDANGSYNTKDIDKVNVKVEEAEDFSNLEIADIICQTLGVLSIQLTTGS